MQQRDIHYIYTIDIEESTHSTIYVYTTGQGDARHSPFEFRFGDAGVVYVTLH